MVILAEVASDSNIRRSSLVNGRHFRFEVPEMRKSQNQSKKSRTYFHSKNVGENESKHESYTFY